MEETYSEMNTQGTAVWFPGEPLLPPARLRRSGAEARNALERHRDGDAAEGRQGHCEPRQHVEADHEASAGDVRPVVYQDGADGDGEGVAVGAERRTHCDVHEQDGHGAP